MGERRGAIRDGVGALEVGRRHVEVRLIEHGVLRHRRWDRLRQGSPIPQVRPLPCPPPRRATAEKSAQRGPEPRAGRPRGTPPPSRRHRAFGRGSSRCRSREIEAGTPRPRDGWRRRRQPEVRQDGHDNFARRDVSHDRPPPTARAGQNLHQIDAPKKLGPLDPRARRLHDAVPEACPRAATHGALAVAAAVLPPEGQEGVTQVIAIEPTVAP